MQSPLHDEKDTLADEVRDATALLEGIAADHSLLDRLPPEDRQRFHAAVGHFYHPDPVQRRRKRKAQSRERSAAQIPSCANRPSCSIAMSASRSIR